MSFTSTEKSGATRYLSGELSFYRLRIHFRFRSASSCAIYFNKSSKLAGVSTLFPHLCLARPRLRTCSPHASQVLLPASDQLDFRVFAPFSRAIVGGRGVGFLSMSCGLGERERSKQNGLILNMPCLITQSMAY